MVARPLTLPTADRSVAGKRGLAPDERQGAKLKIIAVAAALFVTLATSAPTLAATHNFTLNNFTSTTVTRVTVKDGKVIGFKRVLARSSFSFQVEFPDGQCISKSVRISFDNGTKDSIRNYNVCKDGGVTVVGR